MKSASNNKENGTVTRDRSGVSRIRKVCETLWELDIELKALQEAEKRLKANADLTNQIGTPDELSKTKTIIQSSLQTQLELISAQQIEEAVGFGELSEQEANRTKGLMLWHERMQTLTQSRDNVVRDRGLSRE